MPDPAAAAVVSRCTNVTGSRMMMSVLIVMPGVMPTVRPMNTPTAVVRRTRSPDAWERPARTSGLMSRSRSRHDALKQPGRQIHVESVPEQEVEEASRDERPRRDAHGPRLTEQQHQRRREWRGREDKPEAPPGFGIVVRKENKLFFDETLQ